MKNGVFLLLLNLTLNLGALAQSADSIQGTLQGKQLLQEKEERALIRSVRIAGAQDAVLTKLMGSQGCKISSFVRTSAVDLGVKSDKLVYVLDHEHAKQLHQDVDAQTEMTRELIAGIRKSERGLKLLQTLCAKSKVNQVPLYFVFELYRPSLTLTPSDLKIVETKLMIDGSFFTVGPSQGQFTVSLVGSRTLTEKLNKKPRLNIKSRKAIAKALDQLADKYL